MWRHIQFKTMVPQEVLRIQILIRIQICIDPHGSSALGSWIPGSGSASNLKVGSGSTCNCCKSATLGRWYLFAHSFLRYLPRKLTFLHKFRQVRKHVIKKGHDRTPAVICECGKKYKGNSSGGIYHHRYRTNVLCYEKFNSIEKLLTLHLLPNLIVWKSSAPLSFKIFVAIWTITKLYFTSLLEPPTKKAVPCAFFLLFRVRAEQKYQTNWHH